MRKVLFLCTLVFSLFVSTLMPLHTSAQTTIHKAVYYVKADNVPLYKERNTKSTIIAKLTKNTQIQSSEKAIVSNITWYKVKVGTKTGWILASQVSKVKILSDYEKLKAVSKKYGAVFSSKTLTEGNKEYLLKKRYEQVWMTHYTKTKTVGKNVIYVKSKEVTAPPAMFAAGIDSAIALGFPIGRTELVNLAKKAQSNPHKSFFANGKKVSVYSDRGKQIYLKFYEDPNAATLLGF
jgi:hypothetical protein